MRWYHWFLSTAAVLVLTTTAFAQITITSSDILALKGKTQIISSADTDSVAITASAGSAGANQMWDYTGVTGFFQDIPFSFVDPSGTPFAAAFPTANLVQKFSFSDGEGGVFEGYQYILVETNQVQNLGGGSVFDGMAFLDDTSPGELSPLPLTFGMQYNTIESDTTDFAGLITIETTRSSIMVDGWGTLKLPSGNIEVLRIMQLDTCRTVVTAQGVPVSDVTTTYICHDFWGKESPFALAMCSQENESNPNYDNPDDFEWLKSANTTSVEPNKLTSLPTTLVLSQNYPNPFNPSTRINYTLAEAGQVELAVYDMQGRLVAKLIDAEQQAGEHSARWDGTDTQGTRVASGSYVYRLSNNDVVRSKMMVFVK